MNSLEQYCEKVFQPTFDKRKLEIHQSLGPVPLFKWNEVWNFEAMLERRKCVGDQLLRELRTGASWVKEVLGSKVRIVSVSDNFDIEFERNK